MGSIASTIRSSKEKFCDCTRAIDSTEDEEDLPHGFLMPINHEQDQPPHDDDRYQRVREDRISSLSDSILIQILSLLPTKDAVRTSVLSKRWIHLWKFITNLHIDDRSFFYPETDIFFYDFGKLEKFVDAMLPLLHSKNIHTLTFSCWYSYNSSFVHSLISSALDRNVQKLDISFFLMGFVFPLTIFECNTLVELNLKTRHCVLDVSALIHLPNLQILCLFGVWFTNSKVALFDFPVLKVFKLKACSWLNVEEVRINIPLTERFSLKRCENQDDDKLCSIEICAPCVSKLTLVTSQLVQFFPPPNPDYVHTASIGLQMMPSRSSNWELCDEMYLRACRLLEHFDGVKHLKLHMDTIHVLQYGGNFGASLPTFYRLIHLEIDTSETKSGSLLNILQKSPALQILICKTSIRIDKDLVASQMPECLISQLKRVTLKAFDGGEEEFHLAKYVLKNAKVLEQMTITLAPRLWDSKNATEKFEEQLRSGKDSSHVIVEILKHET